MQSRRAFIKVTSAAALASFIPVAGWSNLLGEDKTIHLIQKLLLKGFDEEQEEYPSLVTDGKGNMWIHALRRMAYPENTERLSSFHFDGKKWKEIAAVTPSAGQYEAPVSACAPEGKPVVAWTEIKNNKWLVNASQLKEEGYEKPHTFGTKSGKSINPVLHAVDKNTIWIAWENLYNGKFTIYISKYSKGAWSEPLVIEKPESSCFDPALATAKNGDLYLAYGCNQGYHQNIEMVCIDGNSFQIKKNIPVAVGGGLETRVNINSKPALAFDKENRLWIAFENNRNTTKLDSSDNYTGDRCCAILLYKDNKVMESSTLGKWLFTGANDHRPTFVKNNEGHLYLATHCGGYADKHNWCYRLASLDPQKGWTAPVTVLETTQKGALMQPAVAFDQNNNLWLSTCTEERFPDKVSNSSPEVVRSILTQLSVLEYAIPKVSGKYSTIPFQETKIKEFLPEDNAISQFSGHPKVSGEQITVNGEIFTLLYGNLHEHSERSSCWPAGTDGTLHDDYRFGMFTENYDFGAITDHDYSMTEVYWRKNLRMADFYNEPGVFVALPALEWTLMSDPKLNDIQHGAGHYNVIFPSNEEAIKFIRNNQEVYSYCTPETNNSDALWKFLHQKNINCTTIPHHPADQTHPLDWDVHDDKYVRVVELFQCRGNCEYPGCPREKNVKRHFATKYKKAFVDYALKEKNYQLGFIASGDHNSMGVGVAALWVKEHSRAGIMEALKSKRCFATTGDKISIDFRLNEVVQGSEVQISGAPKLNIVVKGQRELAKVAILRNSQVIKEYDFSNNETTFSTEFVDADFKNENKVLYYYIRVIQKNNEIGWSSPVYIKMI
jgi:hypothetical protein